jgi:hypothetical protein
MRIPASFAAAVCGGILLAQSEDRQPFTLPPAAERTDAAASAPPASQATHRFAAQRTRVHFDQPFADGPLWACGNAWKASFDGAGMTVIPFFGSHAPQNFPLRVELVAATVGGTALPLLPGTPSHDGKQVRTNRGSLVEVIATDLDQIEQSWVFDRLPSRDAIAVDVRMTGEYTTSPIDGGLRFANAHGHIDYTKAVAVDADGRRLPLPIEWLGDRARIEIPQAFVADAALPIVLDPVFNYWYLLGSTAPAGQIQSQSDVATFQALGGRTLMIWRRQWSLLDQDAWGLMFDGALGLVQTDFTLDFTSDDWLKIACAANNYAQNFLVVAEVRLGIQHNIFGRLVSASGLPGSVITIERDGVVGNPGNNFHPDVGSDPYFGVGRYTVVWNKKYLTQSDICMKQITTAGGLVTPLPAYVAATSNELQKPSISKACGRSPGNEYWLVAWQRTYPMPPYDQEVQGRYINWNGAVIGSIFQIAFTVGEETAPSASSPLFANGTQLWPVVYELASGPGQPRDLVCRLYNSSGAQVFSFSPGSGIPGADDWDPEIDSDGTRFTISYSVNQDVEVATYAVLASSIREESRSGIFQVAANDCGQTNICADYSGGNAMTPRYCVSFTDITTNTFNLVAWGGFTGGTTYFTQRDSYCFDDIPITASGIPAIGQTITVQVQGGSPLAATMFGFPDSFLLTPFGCNCLQGVAAGSLFGPSTLNWTVPNKPIYVGIDLSVQGFSLSGTECLNLISISDTIDFRIR